MSLRNLMIDPEDAVRHSDNICSTDSDFIPGPGDHEISKKDAEDALKFLQDFDANNELVLKEGETRTYLFLNEKIENQPEIKELCIADVTRQANKTEWSRSYIASLSFNVKQKFCSLVVDIVQSAKNAKHTLLIFGKAKEIGIAKKVFAEAMQMAGLELDLGGSKKASQDQAESLKEFQARLDRVGFRYNAANSEIAFDSIRKIPEAHQPDAIRMVLNSLTADYIKLKTAVDSVKASQEKRPEYKEIQKLLDHYDGISGDSLYHILKEGVGSRVIDPAGTALKILERNRAVLAQADTYMTAHRAAIETVVVESRRLGSPAPEVIREIIEKNGLSLEELGIKPMQLSFRNDPATSEECSKNMDKIVHLNSASG